MATIKENSHKHNHSVCPTNSTIIHYYFSFKIKIDLINSAAQEVKTTPPQFTQPLKDTTATDGDELILSAVVTGLPTPHISWFHNNENIDKSEDFVLNFDRNTGRCECVIVECLPDDQGSFR